MAGYGLAHSPYSLPDAVGRGMNQFDASPFMPVAILVFIGISGYCMSPHKADGEDLLA